MGTLDKIIEELKKRKKAQKALTTYLGIDDHAFTDWKAGRTNSYMKYLPQIAQFLGVSVDYLAGNVTASNAVRVPVLGKVIAGIPLEAIEDIIDYEEIPAEMAKDGEYFGLQIKGASMEPQMFAGDVIIVRKQQTAESGDIVVALINGSDATVKKIQRKLNGITLLIRITIR